MAEILVLGAGMVGISTALALNARGHAVTVVDRAEPGTGTSYGNSGVIQTEAAEPYAMPRDLRTLWLYATGGSNDVVYRLRDLPRLAPLLWSYYRASAAEVHAGLSRTYSQLTARATAEHAPLIEAAGAGNLIRRTGYLSLIRTERALEKAEREAERLQRTYGVRSRILDAAAVRAEEPALTGGLAGAVHWTQPWTTTDPAGLTASYARLFEARGGRMVVGDARSLRRDGSGWRVDTNDGPITASDCVVALGPWSPDLLAPLGYRIPMLYKRGYHSHFEYGEPLNRPLVDEENGIVLTSMRQGLRITTGAELVHRDAPANHRQLERGLAAARELLAVGEPIAGGTWFGHRPCLPDMLPLVGPAPRHKGLWFHFGHGHQGLTLGPVTANILGALMAGEDDPATAALSPAARPYLA